MDYDDVFKEAIQMTAEQQLRLVFELSQRLGVFMHREQAGEVRKRIQETGAQIENRGGPQIHSHLAELNAPRFALKPQVKKAPHP